MKKEKLSLAQLKIRSFKTDTDTPKEGTIKGGKPPIYLTDNGGCAGQSEMFFCNSLPPACVQTREPASYCCV